MMMEHLPASDAEAIGASLKLVNDAEVYAGVFAHRYGYVPKEHNPQQISITEMEYNRAVECNIPRTIFVMDQAHPITINDIEQGPGLEKLAAFKERVQKDNIVNFFTSPEDLRAHVIQSLSALRKPDLQSFHNVSDIPAPPTPYIAHPYTLLQTHHLVGRQSELNLLTDWLAKPDTNIYRARILSVVAIGGLGKSALTWTWFNDIAPLEMKPLAGRMWWSFYESDATFENFVIRAGAYVTRRSLDEIQQIPAPDREAQLLSALDREPFLIVLDGFERLLNAYAGRDAAPVDDSQVGSQRGLRRTSDPRTGRFFQKLAQVKSSRVLISSRLYPAALENDGGGLIPGSHRIDISGLTDEHAVELWRAFGVSGSRSELLPIFSTTGKHPLLIQALAGEIKRNRRAPGDFQAWRQANPQFHPASFPRLQESMAHVLEFALTGLNEYTRQVLQTIAAFRMPANYDTLAALLVGDGKPFNAENKLDQALAELEDRGLLGWDQRANRYDLHPIVRGVVWNTLGAEAKQGVYSLLRTHFEAVPKVGDWEEVNSLDDLTSVIELYHTLIGLRRYDYAGRLFRERLNRATLYRLSASRQRVELLEQLFPSGTDALPQLRDKRAQAYILNSLAQGYKFSGQPGRATPLQRHANVIDSKMGYEKNLVVGLENLSNTLRVTGELWEAEKAAWLALKITRVRCDRSREAVSLRRLGLTLAARGEANGSALTLHRSMRIWLKQSNRQGDGPVNAYLAQRAIWFHEFREALESAKSAWGIASLRKNERDSIRTARLQGQADLGLGELVRADEWLHQALTRARAVSLVEEELPSLTALAELRQRQGEIKAAREFLDDVWEYAERGPYPLLHADALNVLAQIERDADNTAAAIKAATKAYQLAWCDGPPYAYHWGLVAAEKHLTELGAPLPDMPPFDESKFEPMPQVEIDPDDEFRAGTE
ncbi:MAG: DUF4062 domain-containing protein, partial [Pyrinomonadaceae bacterium]